MGSISFAASISRGIIRRSLGVSCDRSVVSRTVWYRPRRWATSLCAVAAEPEPAAGAGACAAGGAQAASAAASAAAARGNVREVMRISL